MKYNIIIIIFLLTISNVLSLNQCYLPMWGIRTIKVDPVKLTVTPKGPYKPGDKITFSIKFNIKSGRVTSGRIVSSITSGYIKYDEVTKDIRQYFGSYKLNPGTYVIRDKYIVPKRVFPGKYDIRTRFYFNGEAVTMCIPFRAVINPKE